jgi:hypothetical protein
MGEAGRRVFVEIDGCRFCRWREGPTREARLGLSWHGALFGSTLISALFTLATVCMRILPANPILAPRVFAGGALALFFGPYAVGLVMAVRGRVRKVAQMPPPARPHDVPDGAPLVIVAVRSADALGATRGWLYKEAGRLFFRGERFDFVLRRSDFRAPDRVAKQLCSTTPTTLAVPKGLLLRMRMKVLREGDGNDASLRRLLEDWLSQAEPPGVSLLPPIEYGSPEVAFRNLLRDTLSWLPLGLVAAAGMALFIALSPPTLIPDRLGWAQVALVALFIPLLLPLTALGATSTRWSHERAIQKRMVPR